MKDKKLRKEFEILLEALAENCLIKKTRQRVDKPSRAFKSAFSISEVEDMLKLLAKKVGYLIEDKPARMEIRKLTEKEIQQLKELSGEE